MNKSDQIIYVYCINFDVPGTFYADVRDSRNLRGETVFDIVPWEVSEGEFYFEAYGMSNKNDTNGLEKFLKKIDVIEEDAKVLSSDEFDKYKSPIAP
ncbi:MAG: hypothetical protein PHX60_07055 [Giesbergeria sp.]|uniref:hypothetical protein n=1 Tax=Giesbergeria sp. TaxID=2818473 RepID=UPI00262CFE3A|nr:hypothetical protein [Giesbergeria sp.]MDD2609444.1 hypothetical protein [Giesbergeria sp.]